MYKKCDFYISEFVGFVVCIISTLEELWPLYFVITCENLNLSPSTPSRRIEGIAL